MDDQKDTGLPFDREVKRRNLIRLRKARGWSRQELADLYECTYSNIAFLEQGRRGIGRETEAKLVEIFQVDRKEFLRLPPEYGEDLNRLWLQFCELNEGEETDLFKKVLNVFSLVRQGKIPKELISPLKAQIQAIENLAKDN